MYSLKQVDLPAGVAVDDAYLPAPPQVTELPPAAGAPAPALRVDLSVREAEDALYHAAAWDGQDAPSHRVEVNLVPFSTWGDCSSGAMRL